MLALLQRLVEHARGYALAMPTSLPGILAGRRDCRLFDSSTVKLADAQVDTRPGTGDYAALETHAEYSVGVENVVDYSIGPAREHDGPKLVVDENRSRTGILMDLGCTSHDTIRRCEQFDVAFVIGGKTCWNLDLDDSVSAEHKAQKPVSELIMVHASMIATMLTNAVCHAAHVEDVG